MHGLTVLIDLVRLYEHDRGNGKLSVLDYREVAAVLSLFHYAKHCLLFMLELLLKCVLNQAQFVFR